MKTFTDSDVSSDHPFYNWSPLQLAHRCNVVIELAKVGGGINSVYLITRTGKRHASYYMHSFCVLSRLARRLGVDASAPPADPPRAFRTQAA